MALKKNFFKGLQGGVNHSPIKMHHVPPGPLGFGANIASNVLERVFGGSLTDEENNLKKIIIVINNLLLKNC